ncbi:TPA: hypothetical protein ACIAJW_002489, partial [Staphylococcus aureus]
EKVYYFLFIIPNFQIMKICLYILINLKVKNPSVALLINKTKAVSLGHNVLRQSKKADFY